MSIKINSDKLEEDLASLTRVVFNDNTLEVEVTDCCEFEDTDPNKEYCIEVKNVRESEHEEMTSIYFEIEKTHQQYNFNNETMYGFFSVFCSVCYDKFDIWEKVEEIGAKWNR